MKRSLLISTLFSFFCFISYSQQYTLTSQDRKLSAGIEVTIQSVQLTLTKDAEALLKISDLALVTSAEQKPVYVVKHIKRNSIKETITPVIREKSATYQNDYNELIITFKSGTGITFRMYNNGLAYRFSTHQKDSILVYRENLTVNIQEQDSVRYQSQKSFSSAYEEPYEFKQVNALDTTQLINLPLLIEKKKAGFIMITESDLYHYPGLWLKRVGSNQIAGTHPPLPKTYVHTENAYNKGQVEKTQDYIARAAGTRTYPWRVFGIADKEEGLINNNLVYLLATPTHLTDLRWIKPGVVMFDWWGKYNIFGVDFKAGVNTETAKYFIDFCAENGFRYFLFDDGWSPKDDLLHTIQGLNMEEVTAYAHSKGVDVMLWMIWHTLKTQWNEAFDQFERWGIRGIKIDFMNRDDQEMVRFYEDVAAKAAEKKMVVNFHGAYKPSGLRRKYPNVLTREALVEFEYNGWTHLDNPEHHNLLPYIRMFTGPMDYIPATMRNSTKSDFRPVGDYPMGQGTRAHAMALFVILNSPMTMLPGSPSDYYREKDCTDFLAKIPVEWDETRLLAGKIAKYTVLGRRSGMVWHIGAITNDEPRLLEISTDFLAPGNYRIEIIEDGINAVTAATDYKKTEISIRAGESLKLDLAPGGGWVARITPL